MINGLRVQYLDYGMGPAVVLLHGMASSWQWWLENIPALAQQHRVIAVDLPGFGQSDPLPAPAEMATHARTVLDLLTELGIESATVTGHSMGGLVAIEMFKADPRRTSRLILVDSGGVPMSERRLAVILVVLRLCSAILRRRFVRHALATRMWVRRIALRAALRDPRVMSAQLAAMTMPTFGGPGSVDAIPPPRAPCTRRCPNRSPARSYSSGASTTSLCLPSLPTKCTTSYPTANSLFSLTRDIARWSNSPTASTIWRSISWPHAPATAQAAASNTKFAD